MNKRTKFIVQSGVIAGLYVALTMVSSMLGLSSGVIQVRISEALSVLAIFTPSAILGLTVGCLLSNVLSGCIVIDIIFGSFATLIGAVFTWLLRKKPILALFPTIIVNTIIIPLILAYAYHLEQALWFMFLSVFVGEVISVGILGFILYKILDKNKLSEKLS